MAKFEAAIGRYVWLEILGVEYRVYFEGAGQGIPLICQHTAGSDGKQWRHFLTDPDITSRFRVIVPDLPYHGKSLPPESQEWWAEEYRLTKSFFIDFHLGKLRRTTNQPGQTTRASLGQTSIVLFHQSPFRR